MVTEGRMLGAYTADAKNFFDPGWNDHSFAGLIFFGRFHPANKL